MKSIEGDPVNLRPNDLSSSLPPTQDVVHIFANTMEILEGKNLVLSQLVQNAIQDRYQGLSQTSLSDSLSQAISESIMEQVYLFNLLRIMKLKINRTKIPIHSYHHHNFLWIVGRKKEEVRVTSEFCLRWI
jgi:hypothetical protein